MIGWLGSDIGGKDMLESLILIIILMMLMKLVMILMIILSIDETIVDKILRL